MSDSQRVFFQELGAVAANVIGVNTHPAMTNNHPTPGL